MGKYKSFLYMESFAAVGSENSFQFKSNANTSIGRFINARIGEWNAHIVDDCKADLVEIMNKPENERDKNSVHRTEKIISNVGASIETQFVMADPTTLLSFILPTTYFKAVDLVSFDPYPVWKESANPDKKTFILKDDTNEAKAERRREMQQQVNHMFNYV